MSVFELSQDDCLEDAFLAIVTYLDRIEVFDLVTFEKQDLIDQGYALVPSPGETPIKSLVDTHYDICNLNYGNLGFIAKTIYDRVQNDKSKRLAKNELRELIVQAIIAEILEFSKLKPRVRSDIEELLPESF